MRKLLFFFIFLISLHSIFTGCGVHCTLEPPPYGYNVRINLVDKNTGRTLILQRDSVYYPDSVFLEALYLQQTFRMGVISRDTILTSDLLWPGNLFTDTLYFKYRNTKIDTLIIFTHNEKAKACGERFTVLEVDKVIINGVTGCDPCNDFREPLRIKK